MPTNESMGVGVAGSTHNQRVQLMKEFNVRNFKHEYKLMEQRKQAPLAESVTPSAAQEEDFEAKSILTGYAAGETTPRRTGRKRHQLQNSVAPPFATNFAKAPFDRSEASKYGCFMKDQKAIIAEADPSLELLKRGNGKYLPPINRRAVEPQSDSFGIFGAPNELPPSLPPSGRKRQPQPGRKLPLF